MFDSEKSGKRLIIFFILLASAAVFFYFSSRNQITEQRCRELGLPVLKITTNGNKVINKKDDYLDAFYEMDDYYGKCKIRGHGNTTWVTRELYKKPYLLNLEDSAPLAGLTSGKKWILMANTADKAVLRNFYAEHLAKKVFTAQKWIPESKFINLFINGKYNGLYGLTEKVEMANGRLLDVCSAGSFLACANTRMDKDYNFVTDSGVKMSIRSPEAKQNVYLKWQNEIQQIEDIIYSASDEKLGWTPDGLGKYIDLDSFVDWFLLNDFAKNHDSRFQASCFMYYDKALQKLFMGPAWDFDLAFGNIHWDNCEKTDGFWVITEGWYEKLWKLEGFKQAVKNRWNECREELAASKKWLNAQAEKYAQAIEMNYKAWPSLGKRQWPHTPGWKQRKTHAQEMQYFTDWLDARYAWYDENINKL